MTILHAIKSNIHVYFASAHVFDNFVTFSTYLIARWYLIIKIVDTYEGLNIIHVYFFLR